MCAIGTSAATQERAVKADVEIIAVQSTGMADQIARAIQIGNLLHKTSVGVNGSSQLAGEATCTRVCSLSFTLTRPHVSGAVRTTLLAGCGVQVSLFSWRAPDCQRFIGLLCHIRFVLGWRPALQVPA